MCVLRLPSNITPGHLVGGSAVLGSFGASEMCVAEEAKTRGFATPSASTSVERLRAGKPSHPVRLKLYGRVMGGLNAAQHALETFLSRSSLSV